MFWLLRSAVSLGLLLSGAGALAAQDLAVRDAGGSRPNLVIASHPGARPEAAAPLDGRRLLSLLGIRVERTPFLREARLPVAHFLGGRVSLVCVHQTFRQGPALAAPAAYADVAPRSLAGGTPAAHRAGTLGVGLTFRLGRRVTREPSMLERSVFRGRTGSGSD